MVRAVSFILLLAFALRVLAPAPASGGSRSGEHEEPHDDDIQPVNDPDRVTGGTGSDGAGGQGGSSGSTQADENEQLKETLEKLSDVLQEVIEDIIDNSGSASTSAGGGGSNDDNNNDASPTTSAQQIQSVAPLRTTAIPTSLSQAAACLSVSSVYSSCSQAGAASCGGGAADLINCQISAGSWDDRNLHDHASCLCYAGTVDQSSSTSLSWAPGRFDGWVSQCQAFLSTDSAVPSSTVVFADGEVQFTATQVQGQLATFVGLCSQAGDVRAAASTSLTTPSATPPPSSATPQSGSGSSTGDAQARRGGLAWGLIAFASLVASTLPLI